MINTFLHAISKSCMNVVKVLCQLRTSMHACMYALGVQRVNSSIVRCKPFSGLTHRSLAPGHFIVNSNGKRG